jgi:membrane protease YdiL (CAAX protease family)
LAKSAKKNWNQFLSSPQNSWPEPGVGLPPVESQPVLSENPDWSGWDLLQLIGMTVIAMVAVPLALVMLAHLLVYKKLSLTDIAKIPEVVMIAQLLVYAVVFALMRWRVEERGRQFWEGIRWNWPQARWGGFLLVGVALYFVLIGLGQVLPIPKHLPIDRFFQTAREASIMSIIAVTLAPFMEELFFRGFLYPVLVRKMGTIFGILVTSGLFGLLHGAQLGYSWAVLIIFFVGLALTTVRAVTKSVASSFLVHVGYNGTLSLLLFVATSGFRHLERLNQ